MIFNDGDKIYEQAHKTWGTNKQIIKLGEEASELAAAACKFANHTLPINEEKLVDELADTIIMINQTIRNLKILPWVERRVKEKREVLRQYLLKIENTERTFCKDCGIETKPGKGSARCPSCWDERFGDE